MARRGRYGRAAAPRPLRRRRVGRRLHRLVVGLSSGAARPSRRGARSGRRRRGRERTHRRSRARGNRRRRTRSGRQLPGDAGGGGRRRAHRLRSDAARLLDRAPRTPPERSAGMARRRGMDRPRWARSGRHHRPRHRSRARSETHHPQPRGRAPFHSRVRRPHARSERWARHRMGSREPSPVRGKPRGDPCPGYRRRLRVRGGAPAVARAAWRVLPTERPEPPRRRLVRGPARGGDAHRRTLGVSKGRRPVRGGWRST